MSHTRIIAVVCPSRVLVQIGAFAVPALPPSLIGEWALSNTDAGWIIGAFHAAYTLTVPVLVSLTDRIDPKRIYLGSAAFTAMAAIGFATLADGLWSAMFFRAPAAIGWAGGVMAWGLAFAPVAVVLTIGPLALLIPRPKDPPGDRPNET